MATGEHEEILERSTWNKPLEFVLSCLGYAIGLGNVWRFPYLCYRNGGGAFLVTYIIMVFLMGMPLFLLELIVGQYSGLGPDQAFTNIAPLFTGLGYCTLVVITLITIYYMVIIAWTLFYFFASFTGELGFGSCHNDFNTMGCYSATEDSQCPPNSTYYNKQCTLVDEICKSYNFDGASNRTFCYNATSTVHISRVINRTLATYEYFRDYVLAINDATWDNFGGLHWQLLLCLLLSWIIGYFCVIKGVKTSGKAVYFTALFPYVILTALVVQGVILEGAIDGILLYLTPKWEKLLEVDVWANAASQTFYSFGTGCGSLVTLASYNNFNNNCLKDAFIVTATNIFTSVYAGFAIFSMLGFLAHQMGVPVEDVAQDGPGLAFVAYPEAILRLPAPTAWSLAFFFMLFILGLGSQFAGIEAIRCLILDKWPKLRKHEIYITLMICLFCFILAIPMCFNGGVYLFTLMEWNTASWAILLIGMGEVCVVSWCYGCNKFLDNMGQMGMVLSKPARWYWWICWVVITPVTLLGVFIFQMSNMTPATYEDYIFPLWADLLGWMMGLLTLVPFFVLVVVTIWKRDYTGWNLIKPTTKWRPQIVKTESNLTLTKEKLSRDNSSTSVNGL
ncbi:sodium- and chloride-dependent glycine transporter 1-like isoform X1 [Tribolium madens]|uniref:sodium- and chloride-dependent glycine transporter 1-like isoform X1 n=1 Tax=Tribolium madens TaxID=41895 RepID=UPI001CF73D41|nr:sodium- and chloride-dependent glycine transporter 1-like isoform X1 [Tribolium madens]